jgi:hypothetical protein
MILLSESDTMDKKIFAKIKNQESKKDSGINQHFALGSM